MSHNIQTESRESASGDSGGGGGGVQNLMTGSGATLLLTQSTLELRSSSRVRCDFLKADMEKNRLHYGCDILSVHLALTLALKFRHVNLLFPSHVEEISITHAVGNTRGSNDAALITFVPKTLHPKGGCCDITNIEVDPRTFPFRF